MFGCCHNVCSVVCLSVTLVHCDKTTEAMTTRFSLESSEISNFWHCIFDCKIHRGSLDRGLKLGSGGFQLPSLRYVSETVKDRA